MNTYKVDAIGAKCWYLNGKLHRTDAPAVIYPDGRQFWYQKDRLHRTDGPAAIYADGTKGWFLNGNKYNFSEWLMRIDADEKTKTLLMLKWS